MACKMYMIPAHVTGWGFHSYVHDKIHSRKTPSSAVFICQNIKKKLFEDGHFV